MPKQTFLNLPQEKRQALIDLAIEEFANNDYRSASISRIVARAGIAKGSIYQYFEDKRDLYMYLLELAMQEKLALLERNPPPAEMDFFSYIRWLASLSAQAAFANPRLAQVGYRAYYGDLPFHDEVLARMKGASRQYTEKLVREAIARGDIDPAIKPEMAVFFVSTLIAELGNYVFERLGVDPARVGGEGVAVIDAAVVQEVFDDFARLLRDGMANRSAATPNGRTGTPVAGEAKG